MKKDKNNKGFIECLSVFMSDSTGLAQEEIMAELQEEGVDTAELERRVTEIVKKDSANRRLAWRDRAKEKRTEIEKILESKQNAIGASNLRDKIMEILRGSYGHDASAYAEAYFHKKEFLSENDLRGLIEDLEDLNLLEEFGKEED